MPVASRAEKHSFGHVGPPEFHRFADDQVFDVIVLRLCRERQAKRTRTDDQQFSF